MSDQLSDQVRGRILEALEAGKKIQAIKIYQDATDCSLREGKDFIESLIKQFDLQMPGRLKTSSGCAGCVLLFLLATVTLGITWLA